MNKGALRGASGAAALDAKVVAYTTTTSVSNTPTAGTGKEGDVAVAYSDFNSTHKVFLRPPKAKSGDEVVWADTPEWGPDGETIPLPYRSKSQRHSPLMPGWSTLFADSWMTGTAPTDMSVGGTFGGAYYTSSAGTVAYIGRFRNNDTGAQAAMPFFSMEWQITTLPETSRFAWAGQLANSGGLYGYAARVDSAGAVELWMLDAVYGNSRIGTGTFTISANDLIVMERFGYRITIGKVASGARDITSSFISNVRNATASGYDGFAALIAGQSYGYAANAASVRVGRLEFSG